jgi:hypothetical protein
MDEKERKHRLVEFLLHGSCAAFLAALSAVSVQWLWFDINWIFVAVAAGIGFLLAGFVGEPALDWLQEVFRWS